MKLSWGKTQEAAALHCVMRLFPESLLEEVREKEVRGRMGWEGEVTSGSR